MTKILLLAAAVGLLIAAVSTADARGGGDSEPEVALALQDSLPGSHSARMVPSLDIRAHLATHRGA